MYHNVAGMIYRFVSPSNPSPTLPDQPTLLMQSTLIPHQPHSPTYSFNHEPIHPTLIPSLTQDLAEGLFEPEDLNRRPPDEVAAEEANKAYKAVVIAAPVFKKTKAEEMKEKAAARRLKKQEQRKKAGLTPTPTDTSRPTSKNKKRGKHDPDAAVTDSSAYVDRMRKKQAAEAAGPRQRGLRPPPPSKEIAEARRRLEVEQAAENVELARRLKKTKATLTYLQDQVMDPLPLLWSS